MKSPQMPLRKITASLIAGAFLAGSAYADVQVREASLGAGMNVNLLLPVKASPDNYFSGFQNIEVVNGSTSTFSALCVDPFQYSSGTSTAYTTPGFGAHFTATQAKEITQLYNYAYLDIGGDNQKAAAFQLALWEIANDNQNLGTGGVHTTGSTNGSVAAAAQFLLSNFISASDIPSKYSFAVYKSNTYQDFLVATPVPEPGTYAMFLAGLGLMGAIARRRTKAS